MRFAVVLALLFAACVEDVESKTDELAPVNPTKREVATVIMTGVCQVSERCQGRPGDAASSKNCGLDATSTYCSEDLHACAGPDAPLGCGSHTVANCATPASVTLTQAMACADAIANASCTTDRYPSCLWAALELTPPF